MQRPLRPELLRGDAAAPQSSKRIPSFVFPALPSASHVVFHQAVGRACLTREGPRGSCFFVRRVRMASNGGNPQGPSPLLSKPSRPSIGKRREKDENIAQAAGVVVASGIAWSLFRSITGIGKSQEKSDTLSKDVKLTVEHGVKEVEEKAVVVTGNKSSKSGKKKAKGKKVQVKDGDTLWGIARKHNVSVNALMTSNGIRDGDTISAGEFIIIPKAKEQLD